MFFSLFIINKVLWNANQHNSPSTPPPVCRPLSLSLVNDHPNAPLNSKRYKILQLKVVVQCVQLVG